MVQILYLLNKNYSGLTNMLYLCTMNFRQYLHNNFSGQSFTLEGNLLQYYVTYKH